jgi:hypothetical protein
MDSAMHPPEELDEDEHVGTPGSYVINALYIVVFFIAYLYVFYELSHRWPVH